MTNNPAVARSLLVYFICLPLAIFLGFLLSDPLDKQNALMFAGGFMLLALPLLLRWYHAWLIVIWNMTITFIYMPGNLPGWVPMSCIAFVVALGHYIMNRERKFLPTQSISASLVFLALVVLVTAKMRGGFGFNALGDESVGGKRYLYIFVTVLGFFALISQPVPVRKRRLYITLFFLGLATGALNSLSTMLGPIGNVLYIFFPGSNPQTVEIPFAPANLERYGGIAGAFMALALALVALYGIEGTLNFRKPWRPVLFFSALTMSAIGGYRGIIVLLVMILVLVFYFEGLFRSRLMPMAVIGVIAAATVVVSVSDRLPLPVQRCLAILPVKISPIARMSAEASSDWRIEMWKSLLPEIPRYFFLGKGLTFDINDMAMYLTMGSQVGGDVGGGSQLASDYHNGPLSIIIPFGIWGLIGFLWFLLASIRALWKNYKYGEADLRRINTVMLSFFLAKTLMFLFIFGGFYTDLAGLAGVIGLNISMNNGIAAKPVIVTEAAQVSLNRFRRLPMGRPVPSA